MLYAAIHALRVSTYVAGLTDQVGSLSNAQLKCETHLPLQDWHGSCFTCDDFVHDRQEMLLHSLFQHEAMRQVVDVLRRASKVCELQHLHAVFAILQLQQIEYNSNSTLAWCS